MKKNLLKAYCLYVMHKNAFVNLSTGDANPDTGFMVMGEINIPDKPGSIFISIPETKFDIKSLSSIVGDNRKIFNKPNKFLSIEYVPNWNGVEVTAWDFVDDKESAFRLGRTRGKCIIWDNENKTEYTYLDYEK